MRIKFSEYRPSIPLSNAVQTYWTGDFNLYSENQFVQSVVPNGCVEIIIHLTHDHCELVKENCWEKSPEFTLIGLQTRPYEVRFNALVQVFGIRFNPEGIYAIFGVPPAKFTSTFETGKDILGKDFDDYCARLRELKTVGEKIRLTENFLLKKMSAQSSKFDYLQTVPQMIRNKHALLTLGEIFRAMPISPRQLQREFKNKYGITAKEYMRLSRLNTIQKYMQSEKINLTDLTYESGFADQSHFIREFKMLTGINPKAFLKKRNNFIINPADLSPG